MDQPLSSTLEDYLTAIYQLEREKHMARSRDIAGLKRVANSTVTSALQTLAEKGLINYEPYEPITLTSKGRTTAEDLTMRRCILTDFLENVLGLEREKAEGTAGRMEHTVEQEVLGRFICFLAFLNQYTPDGAKLLREFRKFVRLSEHNRICKECIETYLTSLQTNPEGEGRR